MNELTTLSVADYRETTEAIREAMADMTRATSSLQQHAERLELIRATRMYEEDGYAGWEEYCKRGLGITKQHANRQIKAADVIKRLQAEPMGSGLLPNERQVRALAEAPKEEQAEVWAEAVEQHGEKVTAAKIAEVIEQREESASPQPSIANPIDSALADPWWQDACRQLAKLAKAIDARHANLVLRPHMESWTGRVLRDLKGIRSTLRAATPTDRCGKCKGKGCTACLQTGLIVYGQANREGKR